MTTLQLSTPPDSYVCTCPKTIPMVLNPMDISHHWVDLFPNPDFPHEGTPLERFPFHCLRCRKSIAFLAFHLHPVQLEMIQHQVYEWSQQYFAIERLRRGSYLEWADAQLTDPMSPVNVLGLAICADLEAVRKCYYSIFLLDTVYLIEGRKTCPKCQQSLKMFTDREFQDPAYLCAECNIALRVNL
jgi:hypothetical protein